MLASLSLAAAEPQELRGIASGTYEAEFEATASTGRHTPFWLVSNRAGLGWVREGAGFVRGAVHADGPIGGRWSWSGGIDLVGAWRSQSSFLVREFYGAVQYRNFELTLGSRLTDDRLVDPRLSSGDMLFSGNALPIPQVRLATRDYFAVPGLNRWLGVRAYASLGMYTDGNWQHGFVRGDNKWYKEKLFHSKGIIFRIGRQDRFPLVLEGGLEMAAEFGGKAMVGDRVETSFTHGIKDIIKVIACEGGGSNALPAEASNVLGNHVGEWSARLSYRPAPGWKVAAYYLHFFEDHSMMFMDYTWHDGFYGIEVEAPSNPFISKAVYEYLYTKDQSGAVFWQSSAGNPEQVSGRDNYYGHSLYDGWQNWGMGIGNPLLISPAWNRDGSIVFQCNRIIGHHIGLEGRPCSLLSWRMLASYTRGWGTYNKPYRDIKKNFNFLAEFICTPRQLPGWSATASVAVDAGSMLGRSTGFLLSLRKTGLFR